NVIRLQSTGQGLPDIDQLEVNVLPDTTPPTVNDGQFHYEVNPNTLTFRFNEDVSDSLTIYDLIVSRRGGSPILPVSLSYDAFTDTATWALASPVADGNYTASFVSGGVTDSFGNALSSSPFNFFSMAGDANHDGLVNIVDLQVLAINWQQSSRT